MAIVNAYAVKFICRFAAVSFIIAAACSKDPVDPNAGTFSDSRDSHNYHTVKIGNQTWMSENLAFIQSVYPSAEGSDTVSYTYVYGYENDHLRIAMESYNYVAYGVLYNWTAAMTVCPAGWHLPSDEEWNVLENYLGGDSTVGTRLKSKNGWNSAGNGDNKSGFSGLPGGYRNKAGGFYLLGENAGFWTSTMSDSTDVLVRDLGYNYQELGRSAYNKTGGFSVRCLKN